MHRLSEVFLARGDLGPIRPLSVRHICGLIFILFNFINYDCRRGAACGSTKSISEMTAAGKLSWRFWLNIGLGKKRTCTLKSARIKFAAQPANRSWTLVATFGRPNRGLTTTTTTTWWWLPRIIVFIAWTLLWCSFSTVLSFWSDPSRLAKPGCITTTDYYKGQGFSTLTFQFDLLLFFYACWT